MPLASHRQTFHYGSWGFDIDRTQKLLAEQPRAVVQTPVADWTAAYHLHLLTPDYDGDRAMSEGLSTLPAYILTVDETTKVRDL
ncbi:hypothetical protein [Streptomyces sp. NPDC015414]|uniref:hypothetical protein n=1 Tax=Streptomyces sp. NPDC015414 TaxID=3364957 RepID=UPI0036FF64A2